MRGGTVGMVAVIVAGFCSVCWCQEESRSATVRIRILNCLGGDLGRAKVAAFRSFQSERDFAQRFRGDSAVGIPFGMYHLRAYTTGFRSADRDVPVFQSEVWVVMELVLGMEGMPERYRLSGAVRNSEPSGEEVWLRLAGLYSGVLMDAKANYAGDFTMAGIPTGSYILATIQGKRVLDTRPVQVPTTGPLEIDLQPGK